MYAKFARFFAIATIALVGVNAAPAANVVNIEARAAQADGNLFVCTDINFTGICANFAFDVDTCLNFSSPFQDSISSFGPDVGFICVTFTGETCSGETYQGVSPGFTSLPDGINDEINSFKCFHE